MRLPRTLSGRLLVLFGALFTLTIAAVVSISLVIAHDQLPESLDDQLSATAGQAEERLNRGTPPQEVLNGLSTGAVYLQLADADGHVTSRSTNLNQRTLPTYIRGGQPSNDGLHTLSFQKTQLRLLRHALLNDNGGVTGYVVVAGIVPSGGDEVLDLGLILGSVAAGGLLLLITATFWLARRETAPLRELTEAVRQTAASGFEEPIPASERGSTEARELRAAFRELVERQRQLLARERAFFADSSHVLRTPLAVLQGDVEVLEQGAYGKERQEAVTQARNAIDTMSRTVSGLLLLSRDDEGVAPSGWEVVELPVLLESVVAEARTASPGLGVELERDGAADVAGDPGQLRDLFTSVVENACRYTPAGGTVHVKARTEGDVAVIEVRDTGIGFTDEELTLATDRFYRGPQARRMFPGGSGLGLAIAARIVSLHDGTLTLSRANGGGALVEVKLPTLS